MGQMFSGKVLSSLLIMVELGVLSSSAAFAAEYPVKVDQLGYLPAAKKTAILSYKATNVAGSLTGNVYIRGKADGAVKATLALSAWNAGATHAQSGDVGASADFSGFTTPGVYYISDASNNRLSADFVIGANAYGNGLNAALKTYYYQRIGTNKPASFAGTDFADNNVSYMRYNQDPYATDGASYEAMQSAKTKKDLSGGWMDAGDPNKYTSYAALTLVNLLDAYKRNSWAYGDGVGVPESGNGVSDLIDEVKWEIDFLKRMQDATGTGGFIARVGLFRNNKDASNNNARKIGDDVNPRYYVGECAYSTIAGAAALASSANILNRTSGEYFNGKDLAERAAAAWDRHQNLVADGTIYNAPCDTTNVVLAGSNETPNTTSQDRRLQNDQFAIITATYLYEYYHLKSQTTAQKFKNYIEATVSDTSVTPAVNKPRYTLELTRDMDLVRVALLNYSKLSTVAGAVRTSIQTKIRDNVAAAYPLVPDADLYRASLNDGDYVWSAAAAKHASVAAALLDYASLDDSVLVDLTLRTKALTMANEHAHWVNGANPLSLMMVTNMPAVDPSNASPFDPVTKFNLSVPNMYHTWFGGTASSCTAPGNASLCQVPPPAYLMPGPCNPNFAGRESCFNGGFYQRNFDPLQSTRTFLSVEPSIWVQTFYANLLARTSVGGELVPPAVPTGLVAAVYAHDVNLTWNNAADNSGVIPSYNVYVKAGASAMDPSDLSEDNLVLRNVRTARVGGVSSGALMSTTSASIKGLKCGTAYAVAVESVDASGNRSSGSVNAAGATTACLTTAPTAANTLVVTPVAATSDTEATLTWKGLPAANLSHYEVRVNGRALGQVKPVAGGAYSYKVSGLNCGVTNSFTVRSVHPDGVKVTDASLTPVAAGACVASTIFKQDQGVSALPTRIEYFWAVTNWSTGSEAKISYNGNVMSAVMGAGEELGFSRWLDQSPFVPLTTVATATGLNQNTAKLSFTATVVDPAQVRKAVTLTPKLILTRAGAPGVEVELAATPVNMLYGTSKTIVLDFKTAFIGASVPFDFLKRVHIKLQDGKTGRLDLSDIKILH
jgi:endoglucanase